MVNSTLKNSDLIGVVTSGLCTLHCMATPFLFMAQSYATEDLHVYGPDWWSYLDYIFIVITFLAVYWSSQKTRKNWLKYAFYGCWVALTILILNEKLELLQVGENLKYLATALLIGLHLYNQKYGICQDECRIA